jgi:hypothetical protein
LDQLDYALDTKQIDNPNWLAKVWCLKNQRTKLSLFYKPNLEEGQKYVDLFKTILQCGVFCKWKIDIQFQKLI